MLYTIIGLLVIILDQGVKMWVDKVINYTNTTIKLIPGVLSLVRVQNDGAAFSFLAGGGARIWFIILTLIFTVIVVIALVTNFISGKFGRWCMVLVTAGGLSNCLDRVLYGFVIDMFKVELFDFAVFNVADIFITVFCIAFIIYILFGGEKERDPDEEDEFDEDEEEEDRPKRAKKVKKDKYADLYEEDEDDYPRRSRSSRKASYDEEEEDERPSRARSRKAAYEDEDDYGAGKLSRKASKKASRYDDDERFEEMFGSGKTKKGSAAGKKASRKAAAAEEDYDEVPASRRSSRKSAAEDEYAEVPAKKARRAAPAEEDVIKPLRTAEPKKAPRSESVPQYDPEDPFAEWERANSAARNPAPSIDAPAKKSFRQTVSEAVYEDVPRSKPAEFDFGNDFAKPSAPAKKASVDFDEFDLDSILNEFK